MKASDWIIDFFARRGVDTLYGYIGGMVTHLIDSASRDARVRFVQTYHEQSAAFAAEGYARRRQLPGVAIATSGPGATNLLTGVANAYFDSIPVIYVTGQVHTGEYKYDKPIRQQGFQETDVVSMARPVTKYAVLLDRADRICLEFEKAWHLVQSGRPGPVLIDLPMDMQRQEIDPEKLEHFAPEDEGIMRLDDAAFSAVVEAIRHAARPLLLAGGGAIGATAALNQLSHSGIPIAVSLMGKGAVDEFTPGFVGMIGSYGNRSANLTVGRADLLVAIGSRLDTRQTGARREEFCKGKNIIQIDIDRNEMTSHRLGGRTVYYGDAKDFLTRLAEAADTLNLHPEWLTEIGFLRETYSQTREVERFVVNRMPYDMLEALGAASKPGDIFVADIGQNQMWAAQTLRLREGQSFLTSGGMAPMGYAIPAAIGAVMADPVCRAWVVTGDGGLQIALQSLPLISQYRLPVRVLVMNNASLGMITQFQSLYFHSNFAATTPDGGYEPPACALLAQAFHLPYFCARTPEELTQILRKIPASALVEVKLTAPTTVSPKLEYDRPFYDMSPPLPEEELRKAMKLSKEKK